MLRQIVAQKKSSVKKKEKMSTVKGRVMQFEWKKREWCAFLSQTRSAQRWKNILTGTDVSKFERLSVILLKTSRTNGDINVEDFQIGTTRKAISEELSTPPPSQGVISVTPPTSAGIS